MGPRGERGSPSSLRAKGRPGWSRPAHQEPHGRAGWPRAKGSQEQGWVWTRGARMLASGDTGDTVCLGQVWRRGGPELDLPGPAQVA